MITHRSPDDDSSPPSPTRRIERLLRVVAIIGFLGWMFSATVAALEPNALRVPVSPWLPIRRDTFGIACFALSGAACFVARWLTVNSLRYLASASAAPTCDGPGLPLRVVLVSHYFPPHMGGVEQVVAEQARVLSALGHDVDVVTTSIGHETQVEQTGGGYRVIRIPACNLVESRFGVPFPLLAPWHCAAFFRAIKHADVVHVHDLLYMTSWYATLVAAAVQRPVVLTQHVGLVRHNSKTVVAVERLVQSTVGRAVVHAARQITYLNSGVADLLVSLGADLERLQFVPNGVDADRFRPATGPERAAIRRRLKLPEHGIVALFVGRLVPKKGIDFALALPCRSYRLAVAGGEVPPGVEVRSAVTVLGRRSAAEMPDVYRAADVFVLPSESEGFPMSAMEAMATGLPVVLADDPGYGVYDFDDTRIALVDRSVRDIDDALETICRDEHLRIAMGEYSREFAVDRLTWLAHGRRLSTIYSDVRDRPRDSGRPRVPRVRVAALRVTWCYSAAISVYLAVNRLTHPYTMAMPLTHLSSWPSERTTLTVSVVVTAVALVAERRLLRAVDVPHCKGQSRA